MKSKDPFKTSSNRKTVARIPRFNNTSKLTGRWRQNGNLIIVKFDGERETIAHYIIISENEIIRSPGTTVYVRGC